MRFKYKLLIFLLSLGILSCVFSQYTYSVLVLYELGLPKNVVMDVIHDDSFISSLDVNMSSLESKADVLSFYNNIIEDGNYSLKEIDSSDDSVTYSISTDNIALFNVRLSKVYEDTKLSLLTVNRWEILSSEVLSNYNYDFSIPSNYSLFINGVDASSMYNSSDKIDFLSNIYEYDSSLVKINKYHFDFVSLPKIEIKDNLGNIVSFDGNKVDIEPNFVSYNNLDSASALFKSGVDPLVFARNWSLFMSNDLGGGFGSIKPYLVYKSYLYNKAYSFSISDALFINAHQLDSNLFENESISDIVFYSDNTFSCVVDLTKNVVTHEKRVKVRSYDKIFFSYIDGQYKVIDMQSLSR